MFKRLDSGTLDSRYQKILDQLDTLKGDVSVAIGQVDESIAKLNVERTALGRLQGLVK